MIGHPDLKLWVPFMGDTGNDYSGNGNNMTATTSGTGTIVYSAGVKGRAATFTGTSGDNNSANKASMTVGTSFCNADNWCISADVVISGTNGGYIVACGQTNNVNEMVYLYINSAGKVQGFIRDSSGNAISTGLSVASVNNGTNKNLQLVRRNKTSAELYIDGAFDSSGSNASIGTLSTTDTSIGKITTSNNGGYWEARFTLSDMQIYQFAPPVSDIKRIAVGLHPLTRS